MLFRSLQNEVSKKGDAGFDLTLTDYWGRMYQTLFLFVSLQLTECYFFLAGGLSRHLVNNSNHGLATTYSSVRNLSAYTGYGMPFPIIIA